MDEADYTPLEIDYLAKDYSSFRRLMLDHLKLRISDWNEPSAADLGNVIVEVLAYAADYLSYYQDAVATEAYLGTARRRRSIKRHARLLDYHIHEGCNARVWVHVHVTDRVSVRKHTQLFTRLDRLASVTLIPSNSANYYDALAQQAQIFETMHNSTLYPEHNEIRFYYERGHRSWLRQGDTHATLLDQSLDPKHPGRVSGNLHVGQVLLFEQVKNTEIGPDPTHRHVVRVTDIQPDTDKGTVVVNWDEADALPFDLPVALSVDHISVDDASVARGNMILADHGQTIAHESLPPVPPGMRYRPMLQNVGLTYQVRGNYAPIHLPSAQAALVQDVRKALPSVALFEQTRSVPTEMKIDLPDAIDDNTLLSNQFTHIIESVGITVSHGADPTLVRSGRLEITDADRKQDIVAELQNDQLRITLYNRWTVRPDLLSSGPLSEDYLVDVEEDGRAFLRFGFGGHGRLPLPDDQFVATYRIGTGSAGNVRADTIAHIVTDDPGITTVYNPLPAQGGTDRESAEDAQLYAPSLFQSQQRCVTEEDYTTVAQSHPEVLHAVTQLQWTGSWHTAFIYVQRRRGLPVDQTFQSQIKRFLDACRLTGYELEIRAPYFVALDVELKVTIQRGHDNNSIHVALTRAFSNTILPDGTPGFFYPDRFSFGQNVYASQIIATAMAVPGVAQVELTRFNRWGEPEQRQPGASLSIQPLEIARVDNDPDHQNNGAIKFTYKSSL